ncbi:MAG: SDR family NAD(P)-dependent oxidoreductase [Clostridia bacterium]|nr:SDR family NAD(P)-dependent oxidoreductase [Clostridia bacterium]
MLEDLVRISNKYGMRDDCVIAGGGNSSVKDENHIYVKASGTTLATITSDGFVKMNRSALAEMFNRVYSDKTEEREAEVLNDLLNAREKSEYSKRPSVETSLHDLMPQKYVLHLHPTAVNALSCAKDGEKYAREILGNGIVWVEPTEPGWTLAVAVKKAIDAYKAETGSDANIIILANHGIFVGADTVEEIDSIYGEIFEKINRRLSLVPDLSPVEFDREKAAYSAPAIRMILKGESATSSVVFRTNSEIKAYTADKNTFAPIAKAYTPDHMVYCNNDFLFVPSVEGIDAQDDLIKEKIDEYINKYGYSPKIIALQNVGVFAHGATKKAADVAMKLFIDNMKIASYSRNFGGNAFPPQKLVDFINNWDAERYRRSVSFTGTNKRLGEKIVIVTGAAQGFGAGIADSLIEAGAKTVIADLNYDLAKKNVEAINEKFGDGTSLAVKADVSDEANVQNMIFETVFEYGGLDLFVNNAGIAKPGNLEEMSPSLFELITKINYTAYFLCTKHAARIMKIQHKYDENYYTDIVCVNSKSGLQGSNKNFAYAGSKFGSVGLTQSFALELLDYNIKVNAVCPGNFFDGPLWSDPVKGLFTLYLNSGKVPGAKTVADVKKYYESKIPMRRGCLPSDVARAIMYCVEQEYETGQAIPVTGGQVMLK